MCSFQIYMIFVWGVDSFCLTIFSFDHIAYDVCVHSVIVFSKAIEFVFKTCLSLVLLTLSAQIVAIGR